VSRHPGPGGRPTAVGRLGRAERSPQALAPRRPRARLLWWIGAGAAAVVAAVAVVIAVTVGGRSTPGAGTSSPAGGVAPAVGARAPGGTFTTVSGTARTISSLRGRPAMVWFVASWCPSCQAGTQALASKITAFARMGVRVVELEDYADLGQPGPGIAAFGHRFAGAAYHNPDWTFGVASQALTSAYDPQGFLDIYYLLDSAGRVTYINAAPGSTMSQLLARAARLR